MAKYSNRDHYLDPDTGVLKNKLGISNQAILEKQEADYVAARSFDLATNGMMNISELDISTPLYTRAI